MIVVDADALGRRRTGDETYVAGLLGALARQRGELRVAAVTRRPDLVPAGIEALELAGMAVRDDHCRSAHASSSR